MNDYQLLDWDSDFFGFKVAKILSTNLNAAQLNRIIVKLQLDNIKLAYWPINCADEISINTANNSGGLLVDNKITYRIVLNRINCTKECSTNLISEYNKDIPTLELEALALSSGIYSRFNVDKKLHCNFERLYKTWILKSVQKVISDKILTVQDDKMRGMITLKSHGKKGVIGLLAVDSESRGRGIGVALIEAALIWFKSNGCEIVDVVTQADNQPACKLYEKIGFKINSIERYFHLWL